MRQLLFAGAAAMAIAASAGAAQAQTADWAGFYVGGQMGVPTHNENSGETIGFDTDLDGRSGDTVRTLAGANAFSPGFCGGGAVGPTPGQGCGDDDDRGAEYGLRAGYDWQFGPMVLGIVGGASKTDIDDSVTAFSTTPAFYTMKRELTSIIALRARAGYAAGSNLFYATGGAAQGEINHSFASNNVVNTFVQTSDDKANGYQLGGGYERQLTPNVRVGLEYLFTRLEDDGHKVRAQGPAPAANPFILTNTGGTDFRRSEEDFETHSVRFTAAYRF